MKNLLLVFNLLGWSAGAAFLWTTVYGPLFDRADTWAQDPAQLVPALLLNVAIGLGVAILKQHDIVIAVRLALLAAIPAVAGALFSIVALAAAVVELLLHPGGEAALGVLFAALLITWFVALVVLVVWPLVDAWKFPARYLLRGTLLESWPHCLGAAFLTFLSWGPIRHHGFCAFGPEPLDPGIVWSSAQYCMTLGGLSVLLSLATASIGTLHIQRKSFGARS